MKFFSTFLFWNNPKIVQYFKDKPADYRVQNRLEQISAEKRSAMNALDLGCGGGRHSELLVRLGFATHILDHNPQMLKCATRRVGADSLRSIKKGSIIKLPYADNMFNAVVTTGVLHQAKNFHEYERAVSELARVTKSSGVVCLNIFTSKATDESMQKLNDAFAYRTQEGLFMTLLRKECFYDLMRWYGFTLEEELSEDVVNENTGRRSVLRCNFIKQ